MSSLISLRENVTLYHLLQRKVASADSQVRTPQKRRYFCWLLSASAQSGARVLSKAKGEKSLYSEQLNNHCLQKKHNYYRQGFTAVSLSKPTFESSAWSANHQHVSLTPLPSLTLTASTQHFGWEKPGGDIFNTQSDRFKTAENSLWTISQCISLSRTLHSYYVE